MFNDLWHEIYEWSPSKILETDYLAVTKPDEKVSLNITLRNGM